MSRERDSELLRLWGTAGVPVEDPEAIAARRARTVALIEKTLRKGAENREKRQRWSTARRSAAMALAASAVLALGALGAFRAMNRSADHSSAVLGASTGSVPEVRVVFGRFTREGRVLESGGTVGVGASLATNADTPARLAIGVPAGALDEPASASRAEAFRAGGAARVDVAGGAQLKVTKLAALERRLALSAGRVDVEVTPDTVRRKFVVETPDAEVVVKGTIFSVSVEPRPSGASVTRISVSRGEVEVDVRGRAVATLRAGQVWSSEGGQGAVGRDAVGGPSSANVSGVSPADSDSKVPGLKAAGSKLPLSKLAAAKLAGLKSPGAVGESRDIATEPLPPGTLAAENALFASAVEARNRGDDAQASELFGRFVSRHARSPLRQEAEVEAFRALQRQGRSAEAASQARRYLRDHEQGFARTEARELLLSPSKP